VSASRAELAAKLAHDVGKYVARTARNLPPGAVPPELVKMMVKDVWALPGSRRASDLFEELAAPLAQLVAAPEPRLERARSLLRELDALEAAVRAAEPAAVRAAAAHALEIETLLRGIAADARSGGSAR
jgi:hypothetical protein